MQRLMRRMEQLAEDMAEQVRGFRGRRNHLVRSVHDLLGRYRDDQAEGVPDDELRQQVIETTQSLVAQKIQTMNRPASFCHTRPKVPMHPYAGGVYLRSPLRRFRYELASPPIV